MRLQLILAAILLVVTGVFAQILGPVVMSTAPATVASAWSVVQHTLSDDPVGCQGIATCAITIPSTASGNVLVYSITGYRTDTATVTYSSMTGGVGETWAECTACRTTENYSGTNNLTNIISYTLRSTAADTIITMSFGGTGSSFNDTAVEVWELKWTGSTKAFDVGGATAIGTACTSCTGQALTLTGANDVILQMINPENTCTAITGGAGYTTYAYFGTTYPAGFAGAINTTTSTAPTWTCTSGKAAVSAMALAGS